MRPALGRSFSEEEWIRQENVAILTDAFWRERFNSDQTLWVARPGLTGSPERSLGLPPDFAFFRPRRACLSR